MELLLVYYRPIRDWWLMYHSCSPHIHRTLLVPTLGWVDMAALFIYVFKLYPGVNSNPGLADQFSPARLLSVPSIMPPRSTCYAGLLSSSLKMGFY